MSLLPPSRYFPPAESADPQGLVAVGGEMSPTWLIDAYQHGIFPWPVHGGLLAWWSPDPRAVMEFDNLYISRRLWRTVRSGRFQVTCDQDFRGVMRGCATAQGRTFTTWITPELADAFQHLHELNIAHSIEVWQDGELAGGTYGVSLGGLFAAESMFYYRRDASKVGLVYLVNHLRQRGYQLLDIQQLTEHTLRMGGSEVRRSTYLRRLAAAVRLKINFGKELEPLPDSLPLSD